MVDDSFRDVASRVGRSQAQWAATTVGAALLALSVLVCAWLTQSSLEFAHQATCGPVPPIEWRLHILYVGLSVYAAFALPTPFLLWRGGVNQLTAAIGLACFAILTPFMWTVFTLFSSAMC